MQLRIFLVLWSDKDMSQVQIQALDSCTDSASISLGMSPRIRTIDKSSFPAFIPESSFQVMMLSSVLRIGPTVFLKYTLL